MDALSLLYGGIAGAAFATAVKAGREHRTLPVGLADMLQWGFLVEGPDNAVVINKDGALVGAWRYSGPDTATASADVLDAVARQVNDALLPLSDGWMWHVDAVRRSAEPYTPGVFPSRSVDAPDISVPGWIDAERRAAFAGPAQHGPHTPAQFVSEYTLTLTYLPPPTTHARAAGVFVSGRGAGRGTGVAAAFAGLLVEFQRHAALLEQRFGGRFALQRLAADALVSHLHRCVTTLEHLVAPPPVGAYLNTVIADQEFVPGFVPRIGDRHLHVVAIEGYPNERGGGRLDFLNSLPIPYRWSSRFIPVGQRGADKLIRRHRQAWFSKRKDLGTFLREMTSNREPSGYERQQDDELFGDQDASAMLRDLNAAQAINAAGAVRYGFSTQVVVVADTDLATSAAYAAALTRALHDHGFTARLETVNAPEAFFGSLPGHGYQNLRRPLLHSKNLADLWPLTSVWPGLATNPSQYFPAGTPPLMHVATDGSTPFRLNLHVGDVGHTIVVGATGAGKSTLLGLVQAQWQRYAATLGAQTVVFDYDYSHWLLGRACGAQHYDLCAGRPDAVAFQPLADVDQPAERAWAGSWLEVLLELQGVAVTPERRGRLARALALVGEQPRPHRTLTELVTQVQDAALREAFAPYLAGGTYGQLFDAAADAVGDARYQVFELKHLLALGDKIVSPAFLYLAHRLERQLDGRPTLTVVEEVHALLKAGFPDLLRGWLLTQRKRNGAVVLVFHTPAQLEQLPARAVIVESCPTRILLPNAEARTELNARCYRELGLSDTELALVADAVPKRDYYVRSPLGARVVRLDLGPVARAFVGLPTGSGPDAMRRAVAALETEHGSRWPLAWLAGQGTAPPPGVVIASTVDSGHSPRPVAMPARPYPLRASEGVAHAHLVESVPV